MLHEARRCEGISVNLEPLRHRVRAPKLHVICIRTPCEIYNRHEQPTTKTTASGAPKEFLDHSVEWKKKERRPERQGG